MRRRPLLENIFGGQTATWQRNLLLRLQGLSYFISISQKAQLVRNLLPLSSLSFLFSSTRLSGEGGLGALKQVKSCPLCFHFLNTPSAIVTKRERTHKSWRVMLSDFWKCFEKQKLAPINVLRNWKFQKRPLCLRYDRGLSILWFIPFNLIHVFFEEVRLWSIGERLGIDRWSSFCLIRFCT